MSRLTRRFTTTIARSMRAIAAPRTVARAHCDLPCGVYDPEQARIEAESCYKIIEKWAGNEDPTFRTRAVAIKEERAELVKHHLDVLWHDYFKPEHLGTFPNLHETFWNAAKAASKVKASTGPNRCESIGGPEPTDAAAFSSASAVSHASPGPRVR